MSAYLSGLSADRRDVAPGLIANLMTVSPNPPLFVSASTDGHTIASGLTIVDGQLASVQCMATLPEARRRGGARDVLAAIEAIAARRDATHLYLQTSGDNAAARALYSASGFTVVGRYWTRSAPQPAVTPR
jgi:ribosomal protein S18 acetylase RimI-like enzyme